MISLADCYKMKERTSIPKFLFPKQGVGFSAHVLHERPLLLQHC